jgi:hypothetical protein
MARTFASASSERITLGLGNLSFAFGPGTMAAIVRPISNTGSTQMVFYVGGAALSSYGMGLDGSMQGQLILNNTFAAAAPALALGEWYLIATAKASGTVAVRVHVYRYSTNVWTHTDATTLANSAIPTTGAYLGIRGSGPDLPYNGDIAVAGVWDGVHSDSQIESFPFDLAAWYAPAQPRGLWVLDQSAVAMSVPDLSGGGANQSAITGTSVSTSSVPVWTPGIGVEAA